MASSRADMNFELFKNESWLIFSTYSLVNGFSVFEALKIYWRIRKIHVYLT